MVSLESARATIPPGTSTHDVLYPDGDTNDIIKAILYADERSAPFTEKFSRQFRGMSPLQVGRALWYFLKENVRYKEDVRGTQNVKSPAQLITDMEGDCKSYSIFIASVLKNLGIPHFFRFATYLDRFGNIPPRVSHVYVVIPDGSKEIIVDAVYDRFNKQKEPLFRQTDIMAKIAYVHGVDDDNSVGCACNHSVGSLSESDKYAVKMGLFVSVMLIGTAVVIKRNFSSKRRK